MKARLSLGLVILLVLLSALPGQVQGPESQTSLGTPFTYQGVLRSGNIPVSGACDFQFSLWDSASAGTQIGSTWPQAGVAVTRGLFTVLLDFGAPPFQGANRFLEIAVRCPAGSGGYTTLTPRQALTPAPYALYAGAAHWAGLLGIPAGFADNVDNDTTYTAGAGLTLVGTQFSAVFAGTGVANTIARSDHEHDARYWKLSGNSGTTPGVNYLGTSDNTILEIKVNNLRALRLEPSAISPNIVAGYPGNNVISGGVGGTVSGGGASGATNRVTDSYGTVSGGLGNQAGNGNVDLADAGYSAIGGGESNTAGGSRSTVSGGFSNAASAWGATVPGGSRNTAAGMNSLAAGNRAKANHASAFVWADSTDADFASTADNQFAVRASGGVLFSGALGDMFRILPNATSPNIIGGHKSNTITAGVAGATIAGGGAPGEVNSVTDSFGAVGGGSNNQAGNGNPNITDALYAVVGGGQLNTAGNFYAVVGGGAGNNATGFGATIAGGQSNDATSGGTTIGGGSDNSATGQDAVVAGGDTNAASGTSSTVSGGYQNAASAMASTVGGGESNVAGHNYATVPGGRNNAATARYSFAAGRRAKADDPGAFVWADETDADFASTANDQFAVRASGGVWFTSALGDMFRMLPHSTAPNIIGGHQGNNISAGVAGATIAGGGISTGFNTVTDQHGTIGGGAGNTSGNNSGTTIDAGYATIAGGWRNIASGAYASIGGGRDHAASAIWSTIGGGYQNAVGVSGGAGTIGGGMNNLVENQASTVAGGQSNTATGVRSTVGGGNGNNARGGYSTVAGGEENSANHLHAAIGGGSQNLVQAQYATVSGGYTNTVSLVATAATIGGGQGNQANQIYTTVGGGYYNTASGNRSTVPGGHQNTAQGDFSFAAGRRAKAISMGCFVWGDSTDADVTCGNANRWVARASGGVYFYTNAAMSSGVYVAAGGGSWSSVSDRAMKDNFEPVDGVEVLARLAQIPLATWNYKSQDAAIRHIGPVAQDFYAAFGVGEDDKHISTIDADGVALAALQGAYTLIQEKDAQIAAQQQQIDDLQSRLTALEALVATMAKGGGK